MKVNIRLNIEKGHVFLIVGAILLLAVAVIGVYAYNSSPANPAVMGHSINEIDGIPTCVAGQALTKTATGWSCIASGGGSSFTIVASAWTGWGGPDITENCPSGYNIIGGTCSWDDSDGAWGDALSFQNGNGWECKSWDGSRRAQAYAFCAK